MPAPPADNAMNLEIRDFLEADRAALQALFVASRNQAFPWVPAGSHRPEDFDAATAGERILVALVRGVPAGFAAVWEADGFLHHLFVAPERQRQGVGRALLAACTPHFGAQGTLKCLQANERALQFYLSQGWRVRAAGESQDGPYLLLAKTFPG